MTSGSPLVTRTLLTRFHQRCAASNSRVPLAQRDGPLFFSVFFMAVRPSAATPAQFARDVTTTLHGVNPALRITPRPAAGQVRALLAQDGLVAPLATFTSLQALLLAASGL